MTNKIQSILIGFMVSLLVSPYLYADIVNINTADAQYMAQNLKGIGEKKAAAIVRYREEYGAFVALEDLVKVKGIGKGIFKKVRSNITLEDMKTTDGLSGIVVNKKEVLLAPKVESNVAKSKEHVKTLQHKKVKTDQVLAEPMPATLHNKASASSMKSSVASINIEKKGQKSTKTPATNIMKSKLKVEKVAVDKRKTDRVNKAVHSLDKSLHLKK